VRGLLDRWVRVGLVTVVGSMAVAVSLGMTPIQFGAGAPDAPSVETLGPVSYTHLDVYKRQTSTRQSKATCVGGFSLSLIHILPLVDAFERAPGAAVSLHVVFRKITWQSRTRLFKIHS